MSENLTYDQQLARVEQIVRELEQTEALSMQEYKEKAAEANQLLDKCQTEIREIARNLGIER